jgi:excisionase family DNA binding protein
VSTTTEQTEAPPGRWLSPAAAAAYASVSVRVIYRWLEDRRLTPYRPTPGRQRVVVDREELDRMILASAS